MTDDSEGGAPATAVPTDAGSDAPAPETAFDEFDKDELVAVMGRSLTARHLLGARAHQNIDRALAAARTFAQRNPRDFEAWSEWAQQSADNMGEAIAMLADEGRFPEGPPDRFPDELVGIGDRHAALRELEQLNASIPIGSEGYMSNAHQARLQGLYAIAHGNGPIAGRGGRAI